MPHRLMKTFKYAIALVLFLGWCSSFSYGGEPSDKFWTKQRVAWTGIHASAATFDVWTTRRGLALGFGEANPLMRPFVTRGTAGQVGAVGISLALDLGLSYLYHRTRWRKLKIVFPVTFTVSHALVGTYNHGLVNGAMP